LGHNIISWGVGPWVKIILQPIFSDWSIKVAPLKVDKTFSKVFFMVKRSSLLQQIVKYAAKGLFDWGCK